MCNMPIYLQKSKQLERALGAIGSFWFFNHIDWKSPRISVQTMCNIPFYLQKSKHCESALGAIRSFWFFNKVPRDSSSNKLVRLIQIRWNDARIVFTWLPYLQGFISRYKKYLTKKTERWLQELAYRQMMAPWNLIKNKTTYFANKKNTLM